jgi:multidrug efflux pump subunit AcrB
MLAIIRLALRRPYTFVVLAILILLIGPLAILRTPTDIFPNIKLRVMGGGWDAGSTATIAAASN